MERLLEALKKRNRVLLEMHLGMLAYGLVCWAAGSLIFSWRLVFAASLWLGVGLAAAAAVHMHWSLDRALVTGDAAPKLVFRDYMFRYVLFALILVIIILTKVLNPLVVFVGYMALKVSALVQPWTHKLCNRVFHETDPIPQPMPEEETKNGFLS